MKFSWGLLLLLIIAYAPSFAQENLKVLKIEISVNDALRNIMNTKTLTLIQKLEFWKPNALFSQYTLNEDVVRLKKYYQQNGFLDPVISTVLIPNKKNKKVSIKMHIDPGEFILNGDLSYYQLSDTLTRAIIYPKGIPKPLRSGERFRDEDVINTEKALTAYYNSRGYPFTTLTREISLNEKSSIAHVNFNISPQQKAYFGPVKLQGDSLISHSYILKHIEINEGTEYSQQKLDQTEEALFELGLFKYITIRAKLDSMENSKIPISIQVKELPRWSFKTGLGYGTEDKIRVSLLLTGLNFLGGGRTFILKGLHSYYVPISIDAKFIQPDLVFKDLDLILNPFYIREREESYVVKRLGTSLTFQKHISKKSLAYLSYNLGLDRVDLSTSSTDSVTDQAESSKNTKSGITLGYRYSTTDNALYPTKGWKYSIITSYMGLGFNSEYHYYRLIPEVNYYRPLIKKVLLACKLKVGIIAPVSGDLLTPLEDRFLMGGALSLRGWGRNMISPVNENGDKIGGNSMLESSVELRFPIYDILSGTTFVDFGNVWEDAWYFDLKDLRSNVGVGLRLKSPIGPIRLDVATPLDEDISNTKFFITVGHAF
jgi:outer membrane protein assembly complex protein YaeT